MVNAKLYGGGLETASELGMIVDDITPEVTGWLPENAFFEAIQKKRSDFWAVYVTTHSNKTFLTTFQDMSVWPVKNGGEPLILLRNCGNTRSFKLSAVNSVSLYKS